MVSLLPLIIKSYLEWIAEDLFQVVHFCLYLTMLLDSTNEKQITIFKRYRHKTISRTKRKEQKRQLDKNKRDLDLFFSQQPPCALCIYQAQTMIANCAQLSLLDYSLPFCFCGVDGQEHSKTYSDPYINFMLHSGFLFHIQVNLKSHQRKEGQHYLASECWRKSKYSTKLKEIRKLNGLNSHVSPFRYASRSFLSGLLTTGMFSV